MQISRCSLALLLAAAGTAALPALARGGTDSGWGPAVEGVQVRIRAEKSVWKAGEAPRLRVEVRATGARPGTLVATSRKGVPASELLVDGMRFQPLTFKPQGAEIPLKSGQALKPFRLTTREFSPWNTIEGIATREGQPAVQLLPGRHYVQVGVRVQWRAPDGSRASQVALSSPVEVTVLPAKGVAGQKEPLPPVPVVTLSELGLMGFG